MISNLKLSLSAAAIATLTLGACSAENIADNTSDAAIFVGKTAVKGVVGAGKLAIRGGKAAVAKAQGSTAERGDFPAGTAVCTNSTGGYYEALKNEAGESVCLPKTDV